MSVWRAPSPASRWPANVPPPATTPEGRYLPILPPMGGTGSFSRRVRGRDDDHLLPLPAGPVSNGEFVPATARARARAGDARGRTAVDAAARRTGMDRRRFLQSAGAVAASLAAFELAACSSPATSSHARGPPSGRGGPL